MTRPDDRVRKMLGHLQVPEPDVPAMAGMTDEPDHLAAERTALLDQYETGTLDPHAANGHRRLHRVDEPDWPEPIYWPDFWAEESTGASWTIEPVIPAGRTTAIFASHKVGKSLLMLDGAAALATGRSALGNRPRAAVPVVYCDLEMGQDDLRERLEDLGYTAEDDLSLLTYYSLPALPPLDSPLGGETMMALVDKANAELTVIDTMARAVTGDENSADTYRNYWRWTGRPLKAAGRTVVRLDHAGKDPDKDQRGSSGKGDDVDLVLRLSPGDGQGLVLTRRATRVGWAPERIGITRQVEPVLRHIVDAVPWPEGTAETAARLQLLDVPPDASTRVASAALRTAGHGRRNGVVVAAQRYRRTSFRGPSDPT